MKQVDVDTIKNEIAKLAELGIDERINVINQIREELHNQSPFKNEPVDFVKWVKNDVVVANEYNPNKVAPPEMELLEVSILNDGYTQPIVSWKRDDGTQEVVDGFHRNRVGKESVVVKDRVKGYLPVVDIRKEQQGKNDRVASTIRHNRARGKHQVSAMSEIVLELKNRNWKNERIAKELGMDMDEILRLCQISGLESMFLDDDFSKSWNIDDAEEWEPLTDDVEQEIVESTRTANTSDEERIFHTFDTWECAKAGFYETKVEGKTTEECEKAYYDVLSDLGRFEKALKKVTKEWKNSCEHYLTNKAMNRIAWLGQASVCIETGIPSTYSRGFYLLSEEQQNKANDLALVYLNKWLKKNNRSEISLEDALSIGRQVEIY